MVQTKSEVWPRIHWNLFGMGQGLVPTQAIFFIFERETKRQSVSQGGAEREGGTESEAGSRLPAVSTEPNTGPELKNGEITT